MTDQPIATVSPPSASSTQLFATAVNYAAGMPRRTSARLAIPASYPLSRATALAVRTRPGGVARPAPRLRDVGRASTIFLVPLMWAAEQPPTQRLIIDEWTGGPLPSQMTSHPWLIPPDKAMIQPVVVLMDGRQIRMDRIDVKLVRSNGGGMTWHYRGSSAAWGFHWKAWQDFGNLDPVSPFRCKLTWSSRGTDAVDFRIKGLFLEAGAWLAVETPIPDGCGDPFRSGDRWLVPVSGERGFIDASSVRYWGRMIAAEPQASSLPLELVQMSLDDIRAGMVGGVDCVLSADVGQPAPWDTQIGGLPWGGPTRLVVRPTARADELIPRVVGDLYDEKPLGLRAYSSQAGSQPAFGLTKAYAALAACDPTWLRLARYSIADNFRGFEHHEADGTELRADGHPGWQTWSGRTNLRSSADRLGKPTWPPEGSFRSTGWTGMDDEHRERLDVWELLVLTGDELVEHNLLHHLESDLGMENGNLGTARAIGRLTADFAWGVRCLPSEAVQRLLVRVREKVATARAQARAWQHGNPVKTINYSVDPRYDVVDPGTGQSAPAWSTWENAWAARGFIELGIALGDDSIVQMGVDLAVSVTKFGFWKDSTNTWRTAYVIHYPGPGTPQEGQPLPSSSYFDGSWQIVEQRFNGVGEPEGTAHWALLAPLLLLKLGKAEGTPAAEIVEQWLGGHPVEAMLPREAELWGPLL